MPAMGTPSSGCGSSWMWGLCGRVRPVCVGGDPVWQVVRYSTPMTSTNAARSETPTMYLDPLVLSRDGRPSTGSPWGADSLDAWRDET